MSATQEIHDMPQSSTTSKKRQSWLGGSIKSLFSQTASNAKAAIYTVRGRLDSPLKHENDPASIQESIHDAEPYRRSTQRHRRTISARTAISSWRSHLPRRSVDHKRHSLADLLDHSEYEERLIAGPESFFGEGPENNIRKTESGLPTRHTPIDIQEHAPSLKLDLGLSDLDFNDQPFCIETVVVHQPEVMTIGRPASPSRLLDVFKNGQSPTASESLMPDPLQPVAEARISTPPTRMELDVRRDATDTITFESPLPGTTLQMDFEKTYPDIAVSIERHVTASPTPEQHETWTELALPKSNFIFPSSHVTRTESESASIVEACSQSSEPSVALNFATGVLVDETNGRSSISPINQLFSIQKPAYSGPPSPDKLVALPIRTRPFVSAHGTNGDIFQQRGIHNSEESDMTVAVLRERTSDDYASVLNKLGTQYDAAPVSTTTRSRLGNRPEKSSSDAILSTSSRDSVSPIPQTKHNTTPQRDGQHSFIDESSPTMTPQWLMRKIQETGSLVTNSSSPAEYGQADVSTHNRFSLLSDQDDSDFEDGADLPECFNIGVTYT